MTEGNGRADASVVEDLISGLRPGREVPAPEALVKVVERDPEAEATLLGYLITEPSQREPILARVTPSSFADDDDLARRLIVLLAADPATADGPTALGDRLGCPTQEKMKLARWASMARQMPLSAYGIAELADRVAIVGAKARAQAQALEVAKEAANDAVPLAKLLTGFADRAAKVQVRDADVETPPTPLGDYLAREDGPTAWLVPNFMARGERLIITATAGVGKSTAMRMIAMTITCGLHPFTHHLATDDPPRVLYVDLENSPRKVRSSLAKLRLTAVQYSTYHEDRFAIAESPHRHVNFLEPKGWTWLSRKIELHQADIVFIGPLYHMFPLGRNNEMGGVGDTVAMTAVLDMLGDRHDVAFVIESHTTPTGIGAPFGSSAWTWWPDAGFVLRRRQGDESPGLPDRVEFSDWRTPRNEACWWPRFLDRTGGWQWGPPKMAEGDDALWLPSDAGDPPAPAAPDLRGERHGAAEADRSRWRYAQPAADNDHNDFLDEWEP